MAVGDEDGPVLPLGTFFGGTAPSSLTVLGGQTVFVYDDVVNEDWGGSGSGQGKCTGAETITLTYDDTTARVVISLSGFGGFTNVLVEQGNDGVHWGTVRGASSYPIVNGVATLYDYEFDAGIVNYYRVTTLVPSSGCQFINTVTPNMTAIWLKSVTRPFLNVSMSGGCTNMGQNGLEYIVDLTSVSRVMRGTAMNIVNRTYPIAVGDIPLARSWHFVMRTWDKTNFQAIDYLLASGDVLFIQVPNYDCANTIEHGYVIAMNPGYTRHHHYRQRVLWETDVQEVAPPGPDVAYNAATWTTVLSQFGSWAGVMAACPTWKDVLALLPSPSEVLVP